jgi:hypothetical protein
MSEQPSTQLKPKTAQILFWLGMAFYLLTRFIALDEFPIYFFSDEAIQTMSLSTWSTAGFVTFRAIFFRFSSRTDNNSISPSRFGCRC